MNKLPLSPHMLAQEFVKDQPWRLLAICILLNQTNGVTQVKPMLADFFDEFTNPWRFLEADEAKVKQFIRPLGFQNIRYNRLVGMTKDWLAGKRPGTDKMYGVGLYAIQSYQIFCQGYLLPDPQDKELRRYVQWAKEEGYQHSEVCHA